MADAAVHMREFDPKAHGLPEDFRLMKFSCLRGCGAKVPRETLLKLLEALEETKKTGGTDGHQNGAVVVKNGADANPFIGVGLDCCVIPVRHGENLSLIQTTDFFYPLINDPYMMGRITCCNVLSDLYAMGVVDADNMLMLLGVSTDMTDQERDIVIPIMLRGFRDCAAEAGTSILGGQTVKNPWLTIGGVVSSVCSKEEFIMPTGALPGDVLLITKPLGMQMAVFAYEWLAQASAGNPEKLNKILPAIDEAGIKKAYFRAMDSMATLSRTAAKLMHKYDAHACTDVTGFGLLGHTANLARVQSKPVDFVIHTLPIIANMAAVSKSAGMLNLQQGLAPETSGGLLIAMSKENAKGYIEEYKKITGKSCWIIGAVEDGTNSAHISPSARVIEVPENDKPDQLW